MQDRHGSAVSTAVSSSIDSTINGKYSLPTFAGLFLFFFSIELGIPLCILHSPVNDSDNCT